MAIFFTSDTHFSHRNVMRYCGRPFKTVEECDEAMIARWNAVVGPSDTIYHLGDVSMHIKPIERILPRLNGHKILIIGNHDLVFPYFTKSRGQKFTNEMMERYKNAGFVRVYPSGLEHYLWDGNRTHIVRLSHFPTKNAYDKGHNNKHDASKPEDTGILNICGHVHQAWLKRGNNVNVGVDVWDFRPVPLGAVVQLWKNGPENMPAPHRLRIAMWKGYHNVMRLFK